MQKLALVALSFVAIAAVKADVLYWMVADDAVNNPTYGVESTAGAAADPFAWIVATDGNNTYTITSSGKSASAVAAASSWDENFGADLGTYIGSSYSYYVELYNGYRTTEQGYDSLLANGYIERPGSISSPTAFNGNAFGQTSGTSYNVPEPTSGLLFVIGGMLLGLKRKRQV
jgi:hypothetical protein